MIWALKNTREEVIKSKRRKPGIIVYRYIQTNFSTSTNYMPAYQEIFVMKKFSVF